MQMNVESKEGYLVLQLAGDFNSNEETEALLSKLKDLATGDLNNVIVDLKNVMYFNSATLGVLISANALFNKNEGKIIFCNPNNDISKIFEITKLHLVVSVIDNCTDAVAKIKG
jgi:stage II sporulation protein AA (anti-sigma F factor antagonist)